MNDIGFSNLLRLNNLAWTTGVYYKPRVDRELLEKYNEGLIFTSGCLAGVIPTSIQMNQIEEAWRWARWFKDLLGDRFLIEYMDHGLKIQQDIIPTLLQIARELKLIVVATNDTHYLEQEDFRAHEVLLSTQTQIPMIVEQDGQRVLNPKRFTYDVPQFYVKSIDQMLETIPEEYLVSVKEVAERCDVKIQYGLDLAPSFPLPPGVSNSDEYLKKIALEGFYRLRLDEKGQEYKDRFKREYEVIVKYKFSDLLLVVWDYMKWSHHENIRTGPRGSAAGSLVVYCLGISDPSCDPIEHGLLFERFINEDRVQPPDIDVDFAVGGRDRVIEYLSEKYGIDKVASIGTRSVLHVAGCIRDTARALALSYETQNKIAKELAPWSNDEEETILSNSLNQILESSEYLRKLSEEEPRLFEYASRIQGLQRQSSKHAAGVVVSKVPLVDCVPLMVRDNNVITQVAMDDVEYLGLLKVDLLGLKALSVIGKCIELVKERDPEAKIELAEIDKKDAEVYNFIRGGNTLGIFQIGTPVMTGFCKRLPISCIDDLAQLIAAYRPSTARAGVTEEYVKVREGKLPPNTYHPLLEDTLSPTGGKMIYQEQIIDVFQIVAGYTRAQADNVRRVMGKMQGEEVLTKHKSAFFKGGLEKDVPEETLHQLWNDLKYFSIYGFNKSHSISYSLMAYHTAYLKCYYPKEFYCATLCFEDDDQKFRAFLGEAKRRDIRVLGPDINRSRENFTIDSEGAIRMGLNRIKNCGMKSVTSVVQSQPFSDWEDFLKRINRSVVNVRVIQFFIMSGAMDALGSRNELLKEIKKHDGTNHSDRWYENEALGAAVLSHPVDRFQSRLDDAGFRPIADVLQGVDPEWSLAGVVSKVTPTVTKHGADMAFVKVTDTSGSVDVIFWPNVYTEHKDLLSIGKCLAVKGRSQIGKEQIEARLVKEVVV
jgi:DNA polymerase-3 subunit alpha